MADASVKEREPQINANGDVSSSSSSSSPRPREGLHEVGPPPFLVKTFEMVENTATDAIVSWSEARNSFIVWDSDKLSATLLPRYFKHSNFSSFIRQLNTYGFKKVDPDRWEFANEGFLGGQKHLLKTIKRRRNVAQNLQEGGDAGGACVELGQYGLEGELQRLRRDRNILMAEIASLRQRQKNAKEYIAAMEERIRKTETKQQQMLTFLSKALDNPNYIQKFSQKSAQRREIQGVETVGKKSRTAITAAENLQEEAPSMAVGGEEEMEKTFYIDLEKESSGEIKDVYEDSAQKPTSSNQESSAEEIWDELWTDYLLGTQSEENTKEEALESDWTEELDDLEDQLNF